MDRLVFDQLKAARDKDLKVNFNWLWSNARSIQRDLIGGDKVIVRKHVTTTFWRKYNVRMRARQSNLVSQKKCLEQIS